MIPLRLEGAWRLVSFDIINPRGERQPWGKAMHGTLIYSAQNSSGLAAATGEVIEQGWMSASINRAVVPEATATPDDILDSCLFYSGSYELCLGEVRHFVTQATDPQRIGRILLRYLEWDGVTLKLSSPPQPWGFAQISWRKLV